MVGTFNPMEFPLLFAEPQRLTETVSWHEHIPFAFVIVQLLRPRVIVELGTQRGDSYCAFCQAVDALKLDARCYAVDTWHGDQHAGYYGPEVLQELRAYHDPLYGRFSSLVQSTFDDAQRQFSDGSIDLLHIDGCHTYEAVRHDFENWLPKVSNRGIVLLHDVNVREHSFGVWVFWEEISGQKPSFTFPHGHGLGVLMVGNELPHALVNFFQFAQQRADAIRRFFFFMGQKISDKREISERNDKIKVLEITAAEQGERIRALETEINRANCELDAVQIAVAERDHQVMEIYRSTSWRITAPMRAAKKALSGYGTFRFRNVLARLGHSCGAVEREDPTNDGRAGGTPQ